MEFDIDKDKVIGVVGFEMGGRSTRIKALAILKNNKTPYMLSEIEAEELFPPKGFIFEPGFFYNYSYQEDQIVSFNVEVNEAVNDEPNKDKFKIRYRESEISSYGINARKLSGFQITDYAVDLSKVRAVADESNGDFFGVTDKYIVGELRMRNGVILPALHRRIKCWDLEEKDILRSNNQVKLHKYPDGVSIVLDCLSDEKLFEWFREKLRSVEPEYVKLLDKKGKWREEIPKLFRKTSEEKNEVDKVRFERINKKVDLLEFSLSDIKLFIDKSETLQVVFEKALEVHKEELKAEYEEELKKYYQEKGKEKKTLVNEIETLRNRIENKETEIEGLEKEIEKLGQNKERIIEDFSIIKEVLGVVGKSGTNISNQLDSFIIEKVEKPYNASFYSTRDDFVNEIQFQLNKYGLFSNYANRLLNVVSLYKGVFVKDIKMGIAFAEATRNANYIIQQVEPDWLHFKDFWKNGLGSIWESAHKSPDTLHFLLLQDVNLSSPECYARPLLDMMNGIRKHIPYGGTVYPNNLKIFATKIFFIDPEIGLPLIEHTFKGWGAVGISDKIYREGGIHCFSTPGYINAKILESYKSDISDKGDVHFKVENNLENLFKTE